MRELLPGIFVMWTARLRILLLFRYENNDLSPRELHKDRKELPAACGIDCGGMEFSLIFSHRDRDRAASVLKR
jgi:hypothetical protein